MTRTLLRGARIITLGQHRPDWEHADILIESDTILEVGPSLDSTGADIIDLDGRIIHPGLVNAHLHTWQTGLRTIGTDWTLAQYLANTHGTIAHYYRPEDMRIAALVGGLGQIDCGITTIGDWCHNNPSPAHSDAAIEGLVESGVRAVFLHGAPYTRIAADSAREIDRLLNGPGRRHDLLTIGMAIRGPQLSSAGRAIDDLRTARERGIIASMHQTGGVMKPAWAQVREQCLFGPNVNIAHGAGLSDEWVEILVDAGVTFTSTPENELGQGHSDPVTAQLLPLGAAPSLGTDTDCVTNGDLHTSARIALAYQRGAGHNKHRQEVGIFSPTTPVTSRQALEWATIEGARALGLADRVGRIEPGMQADLVVLDPRTITMWPATDCIAAALNAHPGTIEAVMVAGRWRKQHHALARTDLPHVLDALEESSDRIIEKFESPDLLTRARQRAVDRIAGHRMRKQLGTPVSRTSQPHRR
ncbi:amidohydrolase family protein [Promicromonospora sp. NPDC060271]|uniref:amidohydrolase family protein n=1 Tax=Promicromonospora sp. NPDC060271 TaxID=3347089 RepID=UPI0036658D81